MLVRFARDTWRDPSLPIIAVIVAAMLGIMMAQAGVFGPAVQWIFRPEVVQ